MQQIKSIIWDVDSTLYRPIPELKPEFDSLFFEYLKIHLPQLSEDERKDRFAAAKKITKASTAALAKLTHQPLTVPAEFIERRSSKNQRLQADPKLINMFRKLLQNPELRQFALRDGTTKDTFVILQKLGLGQIKQRNCEFGPFVKVIGCFDYLNDTKPNLAVFRYFLETFKLSPQETLSVGDRVEIDLIPAKQLGLQTALVWSEENKENLPKEVDYVLSTVYDLPLLLKTASKI